MVDASARVILPGFVNVHHHTWQSLIRNINVANGLVLEPWLQVMFEIFKDLTPEVARAGVYAGLGDALKTGCTTSNDLFYPHPVEGLVVATMLAAEEIGIRLPSVASGLYWEHSFTSDDADERKRAHDTAVAQLHCAKALGADKLMFSSDMPQNTPAELAIFRAVFTSREDLAKVMAGTALRVFDIPLA